jgi:hypothetical protein
MWKNQKLKQYHQLALAPQTLTADANTAGIDCQSINSLAFIVAVGAFAFSGTNKIGLKLQHSDDNVTFVDVTQVYEGVAPLVKELDTPAEQSQTHLVEYRGGKRYARLQLDISGTVSVATSVVAISHDPEKMPPL